MKPVTSLNMTSHSGYERRTVCAHEIRVKKSSGGFTLGLGEPAGGAQALKSWIALSQFSRPLFGVKFGGLVAI